MRVVLLGVACALWGEASASRVAHAAPATSGSAPDTSGSSPIERITVTAEHVRRDLQKTASTISAVSGRTLEQSNVVTVADMNGMVPGLTVSKSAGFEMNVTIRGVGSQTPENSLVAQSGVATYTDGVFLANTIWLDQALFDVDQVEVLRGPQGALYGQSSTGGALVINTRQPELGRFGGHLQAGGGTYSLALGRAEVNVPLGRTLALRGSFQKYDHAPFAHSTYGFGLDDAQTQGGKLALLWRPSEALSATLTGQWYGAVNGGAEQKNILDTTPDPRVVAQDYPSKFALHTSLYHLNLDYRLPWATVRSVTAYQRLNNTIQMNGSRLNVAQLGYYDNVASWATRMNTYTEELSLQSREGARLHWVTGVFLLGQRSSQFVAEFIGSTPAAPDAFVVTPDIAANPPSNLSYGNRTVISRFTVAPYLQWTYDILPTLHLTGGARFNVDRYASGTSSFSAFGSGEGGAHFRSWTPTWKAELSYDLTRDVLLYGDVATGYKPGGINGNLDSRVVGQTFAPERNTTFELGAKSMLLDRRLRLNVAAFFSKYHDMQYIENDPYPYAYGIANVHATEMWGLEGESTYALFDGRLRFDGALGLQDGRVISHDHAVDAATTNAVYASSAACAYGGQYYNTACWSAVETAAPDIHGNMPPQMPHVQGSLSVAWRWTTAWGDIVTRAQYLYRGPMMARVFNAAPVDHVPGYHQVNVYASFAPRASRWEIALTCSNLTNMAGVNSRFTDPYGTGQTSQQFIAPRQIFGTVDYRF
ncbi:TonB-dependent receptor [Ameyamaea chiangmaiensis]|uniref:TonB-dependent receptor n=1 Tax=Ameyamaea chiangmaiensis TaxID=442969 RepID=UPI001BB042C2|nr:TonB-dependent receptor [Ameyamaea chiangmaiensis]MBS4075538.1 TonB-dependent receptor [Ameyamaea chiangmaiensis]